MQSTNMLLLYAGGRRGAHANAKRAAVVAVGDALADSCLPTIYNHLQGQSSMSEPTQPACKDCRYGKPIRIDEVNKAVECRFNPPALVQERGGCVNQLWPIMELPEWCGRFEPY